MSIDHEAEDARTTKATATVRVRFTVEVYVGPWDASSITLSELLERASREGEDEVRRIVSKTGRASVVGKVDADVVIARELDE